jgi:ABC-type sugar transport system ATPase subunit
MGTMNNTAAPLTSAPTVLTVEEVTKTFGATRALVSCNLQLHAGEIIALMGENGSGKSTLVKILAGVHKPDSGSVLRSGEPSSPRTPREAASTGTVAVYQEILVVPTLTVFENIWLGTGGFLRRHGNEVDQRRIADELMSQLVEGSIDLDAPAAGLSVSQQQACCIVRALVRDPQILILDESTSALDVQTRDRLFALVRERARDGKSVIFISHRMDEITDLVDRAVVLRSGSTVGTLQGAEMTPQALVQLMTGDGHLVVNAAEPRPAEAKECLPVLLEVTGIRLTPQAPPFNFVLRAGEIVGLSGLEGHGQDRFLNVVAAGSPTGEVAIVGPDGGRHRLTRRRDGLHHGVAFVPRDRRNEGLFPALSTLDNFSAATLGADRLWGFLRYKHTRRRFADHIDRLRIKTNDVRNPITTLSGGNQQKVILARWLAIRPTVLLLSDPTRGVDLAAKRDIYRVLRELAESGVGIVMLSSEVDELLELMDRIIIFREQTVYDDMPHGDASRERLVAGFFGHQTAPSDGTPPTPPTPAQEQTHA